jgi:hypothetical protein
VLQEMPDTCLVEISLYKGILIHQDYYLNSGDQENGNEMIDEFGKDKYIVNLGHGILPNIPWITLRRLLMQ